MFEKSHAEGEVVSSLYTDPHKLLKDHLPSAIDLQGVLDEFKVFEGTWQAIYPGTSAYTLAQPVFNRQGDLFFELRPHAQLTASSPLPMSPRRLVGTLSGVQSRSPSYSGRSPITRTTSCTYPSLGLPSVLVDVSVSVYSKVEEIRGGSTVVIGGGIANGGHVHGEGYANGSLDSLLLNGGAVSTGGTTTTTTTTTREIRNLGGQTAVSYSAVGGGAAVVSQQRPAAQIQKRDLPMM